MSEGVAEPTTPKPKLSQIPQPNQLGIREEIFKKINRAEFPKAETNEIEALKDMLAVGYDPHNYRPIIKGKSVELRSLQYVKDFDLLKDKKWEPGIEKARNKLMDITAETLIEVSDILGINIPYIYINYVEQQYRESGFNADSLEKGSTGSATVNQFKNGESYSEISIPDFYIANIVKMMQSHNPLVRNKAETKFRETIAHETWHCYVGLLRQKNPSWEEHDKESIKQGMISIFGGNAKKYAHPEEIEARQFALDYLLSRSKGKLIERLQSIPRIFALKQEIGMFQKVFQEQKREHPLK